MKVMKYLKAVDDCSACIRRVSLRVAELSSFISIGNEYSKYSTPYHARS